MKFLGKFFIAIFGIPSTPDDFLFLSFFKIFMLKSRRFTKEKFVNIQGWTKSSYYSKRVQWGFQHPGQNENQFRIFFFIVLSVIRVRLN